MELGAKSFIRLSPDFFDESGLSEAELTQKCYVITGVKKEINLLGCEILTSRKTQGH